MKMTMTDAREIVLGASDPLDATGLRRFTVHIGEAEYTAYGTLDNGDEPYALDYAPSQADFDVVAMALYILFYQ